MKRAEAAGFTSGASGSPADDDLGAALLAMVAEARRRGIDAEEALRVAAAGLRDAVRATDGRST